MTSVLVNRRKCGHTDTDKNLCDGTEARCPVKTEAQTELGSHQPRKAWSLGARAGERQPPAPPPSPGRTCGTAHTLVSNVSPPEPQGNTFLLF